MAPGIAMNRILVTGGGGFIGSHITEHLLQQGVNVRVLDNFSTGKRENLEGLGDGRFKPHRDFELIEGDIRDYDTVKKAALGVDAILHQAALGSVPRSVEDPMTTQRVNADGALNVFLAARDLDIRRVVYASSSSVYGDSSEMPRREGGEGFPLSPYALTKKENESYARLFTQLYGIETIGLRYFNIYGPRQDPDSQYAAVIPLFVKALMAGDTPVIFSDGTQSRDFTYVADVVKANLKALEAPVEACGEAYNIGNGSRVTILELLDILQGLLGSAIKPHFASPRAGDVAHSSAHMTKTRASLGFEASYDLHRGLERSVAWYKQRQ